MFVVSDAAKRNRVGIGHLLVQRHSAIAACLTTNDLTPYGACD